MGLTLRAANVREASAAGICAATVYWEDTGVYSGQSLTFIVETVDAETYASLF